MAGLALLVFLILLVWAEIRVFALIGSETGALLVVAGAFATAALGVRLFRRAGTATLGRLREAATIGRPPVLELADGGAITIAAGLLLLPGFITDAVGFVMFIPGLRTVAALWMLRFLFGLMPVRAVFMGGGSRGPGRREGKTVPNPENPSGMTIDGDFKRED